MTVLAARTDQAERLADRARQALLGRTAVGQWQHVIQIPDVDVWGRELLIDEGVDLSVADTAS